MKKKVSMKYLLEHAEAENLERISRDYPAPESRKKELFPEYAETDDSAPVMHSFRWNTAVSFAAAFMLIAGNVLLFTHFPQPRRTEAQLPEEEAVPVSENLPAEVIPETHSETGTESVSRQTTVIYQLAERDTVPAVTVSAAETSSGTSSSVPSGTGKASETPVQTSGQRLLTTKTTTVAPIQQMPQPLAEPVSQEIHPVLPEIPDYTAHYEKSLNSGEMICYLQSEAHHSKNIDGISEWYQPAILPDGYELNQVYGWDTSTNRTLLFDRNQKKGILFQQNFWKGRRFEIPEQYISEIQPVTVSGISGYTVTYPVTGDGFVHDLASTGNYTPQTMTVLIFDTNLYQFIFKGEDISAEELLMMAEYMKHERFGRYYEGTASGRYQQIEYQWVEDETEPPSDYEPETETVITIPTLPIDEDIPEILGYHISHYVNWKDEEVYSICPDYEFYLAPDGLTGDMKEYDDNHVIRKYYQPTAYPEGFSDAVCGEDLIGTARFLLYPNGTRNSIAFNQDCYAYTDLSEQEMKQCKPVTINGMNGYIRTVPARGESLLGQHMRAFMDLDDYLPVTLTILTWNDGNCMLELTGEDVSEEDLIQMAESCVYETIPRYAGGIRSKLYEGYPFPYQD